MNLRLLGEGRVREWGKVMYTLLYSKWITSKDLLYGTWKSAQCHVAAQMGGGLGEGWIHVCLAESLHCPAESTTTWSTGCIPVQNQMLKNTC